MKRLMDGLEPKNLWWIITHYDCLPAKQLPNFPDLVQQKLKHIFEVTGHNIPKENVIFFNDSMESLQTFVENFQAGSANFGEDVDNRINSIFSDLPNAIKSIGDPALKQELDKVKKDHEEQVADLNKQITDLKNRPPQIIHHHHSGGRGCFAYGTLVLKKMDNGNFEETLIETISAGDIVLSVNKKN